MLNRFVAASKVVDNVFTSEVIAKVEEAMGGMPKPTEQALRASEAVLRARIVSTTHEMMYLLRARELWVQEHTSLLSKLDDLSNTSDL